jgi:hypothetical protein
MKIIKGSRSSNGPEKYWGMYVEIAEGMKLGDCVEFDGDEYTDAQSLKQAIKRIGKYKARIVRDADRDLVYLYVMEK